MDYPVPNFGIDHDVIHTFNSLEKAEEIRKHKWIVDEDPAKGPDEPAYNDEPDLDEDMINTHAHAEMAVDYIKKYKNGESRWAE